MRRKLRQTERERERERERVEKMENIASQATPKMAPRMRKSQTRLVDTFAAQCEICYSWRILRQYEYEEIRSKYYEEPFICRRIYGVSCYVPSDIVHVANYTWTIDKPGIPTTPLGFSRSLVLRTNCSKVDAYYTTPTGNRLKTLNEIAAYLQENPEYKHTSLEGFSFKVPKIIGAVVPACGDGEKPTKKAKTSAL